MLAAVAVAGIGGAEAKVLRIVVDRTEALAASVGAAALEKLRGRAYGEMDPGDPANAVIVDIKLAPRNANGKVEYVSVFELTKPVDMARASGLLWYDLVNRGAPVTLGAGAIRLPA
jgi:hypothetical protein